MSDPRVSVQQAQSLATLTGQHLHDFSCTCDLCMVSVVLHHDL